MGRLRAAASKARWRIARAAPGLAREAESGPAGFLFDSAWYRARYLTVADAKIPAFEHYVRYGADRMNDPHPLFSSFWYCVRYPEFPAEGRSPLHSFMANPDRDPHPLFDSSWYLERNPDVEAAGQTAIEHYLRDGAQEGRAPHVLFDPEYYLSGQSPDLSGDASARADPLRHYLSNPGRNPHPLFDTDWYRTRYPDMAESRMDPACHYLLWGAGQGRRPNPWLSPRHYLVDFPKEDWLGENPLLDLVHRRESLPESKQVHRSALDAGLDAFLASGSRIQFIGENARVTVVIPVFNQAALLLPCLQGLAEQGVPLRPVIVDNASSDAVPTLLGRLDGVQVIRNDVNVGFVDAVNQGFAATDTELVLILNSDAVLRPGSLEAALGAMLADPDLAAVGGRIVLPNGLLQEAGSVLWRNASAAGYLRGYPPSFGAAMSRRDVAFASGVALLMRTQQVRAQGGLSTEFRPAYCEEVDLCVRLWQSGLRVGYEPGFLVEHMEYGSSSGSQHLELMESHRELLVRRHQQWLAELPDQDTVSMDTLAHWRDRGNPRTLVVDDRIPFAENGAGDPRAVSVLHGLSRIGRRALLVPADCDQEFDWTEVWGTLPRDLEIRPEGGVPALPWMIGALADGIDFLWISRIHNLEAVLSLRERDETLSRIPLIYDSEAIAALRCASGSAPDHVALAEEMTQAARADVVVAVNEAEADIFRRHGCPNVAVLGHELRVSAAVASEPTADSSLLFIGRLTDPESPNVDSVRWLIREVLPRIRAAVPTTRVTVVGAISDVVRDQITAGDPAGVRVVGPQSDLGPFYDSHRVFVAPTRFAAGIPIKVLSAAAAGLPVVATPLLAEQLGWVAGRDVLVGQDPGEFATQVIELLGDERLWHSVREAGLARIRAECSTVTFDGALEEIFSMAAEVDRS